MSAIYIMDRVKLRPGQLQKYQQGLRERYLPIARKRGMELVGSFITPPVEVADGNELVTIWSLPSIEAFWGMRAGSSTPEVAAWWEESDRLVENRERKFMTPAEVLMRLVTLIHLRSGVPAARTAEFEAVVAALPGEVSSLRHVHLGRNLEGSIGGGDYTFDALIDGSDVHAVLEAPSLVALRDAGDVIEHLDPVAFEPQNARIAEPEITDCIKRTLFLRVFPGTPAEVTQHFERDLMGMPVHIESIRNWALSRTDPTACPTSWTHVWEQEFPDLNGLQVDYMMHPYHWGLVDGWFDPELPQAIVDVSIAHVFCPAASTILGRK